MQRLWRIGHTFGKLKAVQAMMTIAVTFVSHLPGSRQNFFFFQALNFLVESFGFLNELFPLPSILDAGYPVFDLNLADVLRDVILPSVLGSSS
jgi:hypothetical protein